MLKYNEYAVTISETLLDSFGHVNNANYLRLFEDARWDLISGRDYGLKVVQELKQSPIILEVELKFKKELRSRDRIVISTQCIAYRGKVGVLEQKMTKEGDIVVAIAQFKFGLFDLKERKLIDPTPRWLQAIGWPSP